MLRMRIAEAVGDLRYVMLSLQYLLPRGFQSFVAHETEDALSEQQPESFFELEFIQPAQA